MPLPWLRWGGPDMRNSAGRPYYFALLPPEPLSVDILHEFYDICEKLTSAQAAGMMRALDMSPSSFLNWRYKTRRPSLDVAIRVIRWYREGCDMERRKVSESYVDMV